MRATAAAAAAVRHRVMRGKQSESVLSACGRHQRIHARPVVAEHVRPRGCQQRRQAVVERTAVACHRQGGGVVG
eukprot:259731-Chlamydomonas_euryale.AAC.8